MEKRVIFRDRLLPYLLLLPQIIITVVFFFWPAFQALYQSLFIQDAFGSELQFVGLENFSKLSADESYLGSFKVTAAFSLLATLLGLWISLLLA